MPRFVKGLYDNTGTVVSAAGSTSGSTSSLYIAPAQTSLSESNNYYFTYLTAPSCTGTTSGTASTLYIDGAPTGGSITTRYALNVANGNCYIKGDLTIDGKLTAASGGGGGGTSTLNPKIISTSTPVSLLTTDPTYVVVVGANTFTITLPGIQTTATNGLQYYITNLGTGTVTLSVANTGTENFDGTPITSTTLSQYDRIFIIAITNTGTSQYIWQTY